MDFKWRIPNSPVPEVPLDKIAALTEFLRQRGVPPDKIQETIQNLQLGPKIAEHTQSEELRKFYPREWVGYQAAKEGRRALHGYVDWASTPTAPSLAGATGIPGKGRTPPPGIGMAREPQEGDPFYQPSEIGGAGEPGEGDPFYEAPSIPGQAWGGGGYKLPERVQMVGGRSVSGSGFPSLTGGPVFMGNTPEIAERAAKAAKEGKYTLKETPTGIESKGAFSPGRLPSSYLQKSFEEVHSTESPLIQQLWEENRQKQLADQMTQASLKSEAARARIATEQAEEAELPWDQQMKRYVERQLALRNEILKQSAPSIEALVEGEIAKAKEVYLRASGGKPMPPELEAQKRAELMAAIQSTTLQRVLSTMIPPSDVLSQLARTGMVNPAMLGLQGGGQGVE